MLAQLALAQLMLMLAQLGWIGLGGHAAAELCMALCGSDVN